MARGAAQGQRRSSRDFGLRAAGGPASSGSASGIGTQLVLLPLLYSPIFELFDMTSDDLAEPARELTDRATDAVGVLLLVLIVGIGAPIVEEMFYRGLLLRSLERRFGTGLAGVAVGAVVVRGHPLPAAAVPGAGRCSAWSSR